MRSPSNQNYRFGIQATVTVETENKISVNSGRLCLYAVKIKETYVKYILLRSENTSKTLLKPLYNPQILFIKETGIVFRGYIKTHDRDISTEWLIKFN